LTSLPNISYGGFFTEEIKQNEERVGFKIVTTFGDEAILSHQDYKSSYRISKYGVNLNNLEIFAVNSLVRALKEKDLVVIDEIGKMEIYSEKFKSTVEAIFSESNKKVLASIAISKIPFIDKIRRLPNISLFEVTIENREHLIKKIANSLIS
jgi:nucleoside-triphosphatase